MGMTQMARMSGTTGTTGTTVTTGSRSTDAGHNRGGGARDEGLLRHLALPAEVLLIGVLVCAASLPVVTSLAAAGAGSVLLRELVEDDRTPTVRRFLRLLRDAIRQPARDRQCVQHADDREQRWDSPSDRVGEG